MAEHVAKIFESETLNVDGQHFVDCEFRGVVLAYEGGVVPAFQGCTFQDVHWRMDAAAGRTVELLKFMHTLDHGGLRDSIDQMVGRTC